MKKEKKKMKKPAKICLGIFLGILIALVLFNIIGAIIGVIGNHANYKLATSFDKVQYTERIEPKKDNDGNWFFETDKELKVMQLTDIHIGGGWMSTKKDSMAINAIATMILTEKPDLVVVTGDVAYPVPFQAGTLNNKPPAKIISSLMETLGVYWIPVFGNHDTEAYSYFDREDIGNVYESEEYPHCLFKKGSKSLDGCGNSCIKVVNSDGIVTQSLFLLDSHSYTNDDKLGIMWQYDNIKDSQINWYKNTLNSFILNNKEIINKIYANDETKRNEALENYCKGNSLLFFHIPLVEYKDAWTEYKENGFKGSENVHCYYGGNGEKKDAIFCGVNEDNLFETMQSFGGNIGTFCGHDHLNNFSIDYKGIRLTYGYSIDYLAYIGIAKYGLQRGCTIISVKPDGTFDCYGSNYYDDKYQSSNGYQKEEVNMTPFYTAEERK